LESSKSGGGGRGSKLEDFNESVDWGEQLNNKINIDCHFY